MVASVIWNFAFTLWAGGLASSLLMESMVSSVHALRAAARNTVYISLFFILVLI